MDDASLRFALLGPVRAWAGDRELDLGSAKQRTVLAVLLLNANRPVSAAQIVQGVWGDEPPENGSNVVQKYVAGLRRSLDPHRSARTPGHPLTLTDAGYLLRVGTDRLDADTFTAAVREAAAARGDGRLAEAATILRRALALWRAEPLAGLTGPAIDAARDRLTEARAAGWELWAEVELQRGHHGILVPELVRLVAEFPLREGLRHHLILALYRSGRQAEALAAYRDARRYLAEEFGVEPGERMQELHRRILRGDPALAAPAAGPPPTAPPWHAGPLSPAGPPPVGPPSQPAGSPPPVAPPAAGTSPAAPSSAAPSPAAPSPAAPSPAAPSSVAPLSSVASGPAGYGAVASWDAVPVYAAPTGPAGPAQARWPTWCTVLLAVLVPLSTCGFGSWAFVAYLGTRRRSLAHVLTAVGYLVLMIVSVVTLPLDEPATDTFRPGDAVFLFGMLTVMAVAAVHCGVLAARIAADETTRVQEANRRLRRDQARQLVAREPDLARRLLIGRPDLPRWFDDGGLVDLNSGPAPLLASLPGINPDTAREVERNRERGGPFHSVDDVATRGLVPPPVTAELSELAVCVPWPGADAAGAPSPAVLSRPLP